MTTAKLNAVGHHWVGELSDFRFDVKYRPGKVNINTDTLLRIPLDIEKYVQECMEEFSQDAEHATWQESKAAMQKDVAWIAALNLSSQDTSHLFPSVLPVISHSE